MENKAKSSLLISLITILSFFCIGLGIVSLIAANWQQIPAWFKITTDMVLMLLLVWQIIRTYPQTNHWTEACLILYGILIMATIGLIAQIFQLSSESFSAVLMLWSLLSAPIVLVVKTMVFPFFWIPLFLGSFYDLFLFDSNNSDMTIWMGYLFVLSFLYQVMQRYSVLPQKFIKAFALWLIIGITVSFFLLNVMGSFAFTKDINIYIVMIVVLMWGGVFYINKKEKQTFLLPTILGILGIYFIWLAFGGANGTLLRFLITVIALSVVGAYAYRTNKRKLLILSTILIAGRIFFLFIELFGTLMNTGIILIFSGIFLILSLKIIAKITSPSMKGERNE